MSDSDEVAQVAVRYHAYLKSKRWYELRDAALRRAEWRCQLCDSADRLEVHHRSYKRMRQAGEYRDLIVLCSACHAKHHDKRGPKRRTKLETFLFGNPRAFHKRLVSPDEIKSRKSPRG